MADADANGNHAAYWFWAVGYSAGDGFSFGALTRREKLERAYEDGQISGEGFAAGQIVNVLGVPLTFMPDGERNTVVKM